MQESRPKKVSPRWSNWRSRLRKTKKPRLVSSGVVCCVAVEGGMDDEAVVAGELEEVVGGIGRNLSRECRIQRRYEYGSPLSGAMERA